MFKKIRWSRPRQHQDVDGRRTSDPVGISTHRRISSSSTLDGARGRPSESAPTPVPENGSLYRGRSPSPSRFNFGLRVIHQPEFACLDLVFVHGLGGHSQRTWSKDHDPAFFWPELWLPYEPDVGTARIMTYGYNADWRGSTKNLTNITDFAKELLFELRFAKDDSGHDLDVGARPIIFVVHSMGGLVVKKAYLLGLHDENYKHIVRSISGIIFLSTPHRGSSLAETLNRVLAASFQSSKNFITDLSRTSTAIEELNEQFRHLAPKLSIWSFYETLATAIGPKKIMVLEKDSSVLGYPAEISRPLRADHHGVCKYSSPADSNYISVRNAIKSLVGLFRSKATEDVEAHEAETTVRVQQLFQNCITSEDDYHTLRRQWIPDTCSWFLSEPRVTSWLTQSPDSRSQVLWYSAPPASGKSVLSAYVVNHLIKSDYECQFFLFKYSDPTKRSIASCLRALAFQLARDHPEFRRLLGSSSTEMLQGDTTDPSLIWRSVFERILFHSNIEGHLYWVIDALDECDAPGLFIDCLRSLSESMTCIKVLIVSRNTSAISMAFERLPETLLKAHVETTGLQHTEKDITIFVEQEMKHMRGDAEFRQRLMRNILGRAQGNFLWTKLVLTDIASCHTEEDILEILEEIPDDMMQLYQRMERSLLAARRKPNERLVKTLLEWSICPQRALNLKELSQALQPEFKGFFDLRSTIQAACGQFVQVDSSGKVNILHHTAREYFTTAPNSLFHVDTYETHGNMFKKTLSVLQDDTLRWRLVQEQHTVQASEPFLFYAAVGWPYHLGHSHMFASDHLDALVNFLNSSSVLSWIHVLALLRRLEVLVKASKVVASFVQSTRKRNTSVNPMLHRLSDLELLNRWAIDLVKIVGKFSTDLVSDPAAVYGTIPVLCPEASAIHRQFTDPKSRKLRIIGSAVPEWNDNLAQLPLPGDSRAWCISCAGKYVAVLASTGLVHIWDASNFTETATLDHGEPVTAMTLNGSASKLVTYGLKTTKLWLVPSATLLWSTPNPAHIKAKQIVFSENGQKILLGGDDNTVRFVQCDAFDQSWQIMNARLLVDTTRIEGAVVNSPMCLAFNGDNTQVGVSYRGAPLSVWRLADGKCINKCRRSKEFRDGQRQSSADWFAVDRFTWNPITGHVLGIYRDGCVFKWHPTTDENVEAQSNGDEISASPNGKLFATSSSDGSVRVWGFVSFTVIYQLSSEDLVAGLAFGPDSRRFYDLRGSSVNAWEADSIARFLEADGSISDTASESSYPVSKISEAYHIHVEPVTALAVAPDGASYCAGYADGVVQLFATGESSGIELTRFYNFLQITKLAWSPGGNCVAVADLAGEVQIVIFESPEGQLGKPRGRASIVRPRIRLDHETIEDIVFSLDSEKLLLCTNKRLFLCSVRDGDLGSCTPLDDGDCRKWLIHPHQHDVVLGFGPVDVCAYGLEDTSLLWTVCYRAPRLHGRNESVSSIGTDMKLITEDAASLRMTERVPGLSISTVTKVMLTQDGKHILLQGKSNTAARGVSILMFPTCRLEPGYKPADIQLLSTTSRFSDQTRAALGVIPGVGLAAVDQDLRLCTYSMDFTGDADDDEDPQRFYFIPRDWVGGSSLSCCTMTRDGTLFWPKDDKVIIIGYGFHDRSQS